jgi:hypothetical protein
MAEESYAESILYPFLLLIVVRPNMSTTITIEREEQADALCLSCIAKCFARNFPLHYIFYFELGDASVQVVSSRFERRFVAKVPGPGQKRVEECASIPQNQL